MPTGQQENVPGRGDTWPCRAQSSALHTAVQMAPGSCVRLGSAPRVVSPPGGPSGLQQPALGLSLSVAGRTPAPRTAALSVEAPRPHGRGTPAAPCAPRPCRSPGRGWHSPRKCPLLVREAGPHPPPPRDPASVRRHASGQLLPPAGGGRGERNTNCTKTKPDVGQPGRRPAAGEGDGPGPPAAPSAPHPHVRLCLEGGPQSRG